MNGEVQAIDWGAERQAFDVMDVAAFWSKVDVGSPHDCWEWKGPKRGSPVSGKYYGSFKHMNASRYAAGLKLGRPLNGRDEIACHHCDNPSCVNPRHLYVGTYADNNQDVVDRNRHPEALKTHCKNGHAYAGGNLYVRANGHRECRLCMSASQRRRALARKEAQNA